MPLRMLHILGLLVLTSVGIYACGDDKSTTPDRSDLMSAVIAVGPLIESDGVSSFSVNLSYPKGASYPIETIGAFDLLLKYDTSICGIDSVSQGSALEGWEFFTSRIRPGVCDECTTSGWIRVVALLEIYDETPSTGSRRPTGDLVRVFVKLSLLQDGQKPCTNIEFYVDDCAANTFYDESGNTQFAPDLEISDIIVSPHLIDRDSCAATDYQYIPFIELHGGRICVP